MVVGVDPNETVPVVDASPACSVPIILVFTAELTSVPLSVILELPIVVAPVNLTTVFVVPEKVVPCGLDQWEIKLF